MDFRIGLAQGLNAGEKCVANKRAMITGASSGIGASFARHAAAQGCDIVLVARRKEVLAGLAAEIVAAHGVKASAIAADLCSPEAVNSVLAEAGQIDILINNAGYSIPPLYENTLWPQQRAFLEITVMTPAALVHGVLPGMLKRGFGRIINVASAAAFSSGAAGHTLYPGGKSFLVKFSQSLSAEVKARGVLVSALSPGFVQTGFHEANGTSAQMAKAPRHFWQSPEEVVKEAWTRNAKGHEIIVPGLHNKIAIALLRHLPEAMTQGMVRAQAEKYRVDR